MTQKTITSLPVSLEELQSVIGRTWFDLDDRPSEFIFETRAHGSVGSEMHGETDHVEGIRILKAIREVYPQDLYSSTIETCDEWVTVAVIKAPRSPAERSERALIKSVRKLNARMPEIRNLLPARKVKNARKCLSVWTNLSCRGDVAKLIVSATCGERFLNHHHLEANFEFSTEEEATKAAEGFIASLPTDLPITEEWKKEISLPLQRLSINYSAPNNVTEQVTTITFTAQVV